MRDLKDEELIRELRRAELSEQLTGKSNADPAEQIFAILVERHQVPFTRLVGLRYGIDAATAEEIAQDFWLECYSALPRYNPDRPFLAWATTILFRTAERFLKKRRREVQLSPQSDFFDMQVSLGDTPEDASLGRDEIEAMLRAVRRLPRELALLIHLRYFEKKKIEDIVENTGMARSTIFEKLNQAYREIRSAMDKGMKG